MCEVLKHNFQSLYPKIEKSLKTAAVIAIDSEFSGLVSHSKLKRSLFDSVTEHYTKLKQGIEQFIVFQFGLSVFHFNRDFNQYTADVFNFYIFPHSFGSVDNRFLCQSSSWEFLCTYNFNFNKVAYDGISYLNSQQEKQVSNELFQGLLMRNLERSVSFSDERIIQNECSKILEWSLTAKINDCIFVDLKGIDFRLEYILHKEIRNRFSQVWTYSEALQIRIQKLSEDDISKLKSTDGTQLEETVLNNLIGFSKIFKLLVALKKPIVGHNCLLDFMILYNQFYEPLPNSYDVFKKNINYLFPCIFDTKLISYEVKRLLKYNEGWRGNVLVELYKYFKEGKSLAPFTPKVVLADGLSEPVNSIENRVHEACWDSFMTGYCFIHLAHYKAAQNLGKNSIARPLSKVEHLTGVEEYRNCVNVIRASVAYLNLSGKDPPPSRPKVLHVRRRDFKPLDIEEVTEMLASFGSMDVRAHGCGEALIAVMNQAAALDILSTFKNSVDLRIVPYFPLSHSRLVKAALWTGLTVSSGMCLTYLIHLVRTALRN